MASADTGRGKRKANDPPSGPQLADTGIKWPRGDDTSEVTWPPAWIKIVLEFPSSATTIDQCMRFSALLQRAVSAVPDILATCNPPSHQKDESIDQYLNGIEQTLAEYISKAPQTVDPDDPYSEYADERTMWPLSWSSVWQLLVGRSASSEEHVRYQNIVAAANDYCGGVLDSCEAPSISDYQTIALFLDDVKSTLDRAIREELDQKDDFDQKYASERKSWPKAWQDARESLTDSRASLDQRDTFKDTILATTDGLLSALQSVEPPLLTTTAGIDSWLVEIKNRLRAQEIQRERRATPAQRTRLVESVQKVVDISPEIMDSWTAPVPQENQLLGGFIEEVQNSLQAHKLQCVIDLWENDIAEADTAGAQTRDLMAMRIRLDAMKAYVAKGGEPYKPIDELPADADPTRTLPGFDVLTQDYGFEGPGGGSLSGSWRWEGTIGEGGNGYAGIWLQYDSSGRTVHRVVIKDNYTPGAQWDLPEVCYDFGARVLNEVALAQRLNQCRESHNIVLCYGHRTHVAKRMFRIYLEYCPHGDLEDLIGEHVKIRDQGLQDDSDVPFAFRIPTPALWAMFEGLPAAAFLMHEGRIPMTAARQEWHALLHMNIKPQNVFLGPPDPRSWR